jgi:hypothetical protein
MNGKKGVGGDLWYYDDKDVILSWYGFSNVRGVSGCRTHDLQHVPKTRNLSPKWR